MHWQVHMLSNKTKLLSDSPQRKFCTHNISYWFWKVLEETLIKENIPFKSFIHPFTRPYFQIKFDKCVDFEYICPGLTYYHTLSIYKMKEGVKKFLSLLKIGIDLRQVF